jgi:hypothetical protein
METMIDWLVNFHLLEEPKCFKYPLLVSEIIGCEVVQLSDSLLDNPDALAKLTGLLERPAPLNPLHASFFVKIISVLLQRDPRRMLNYMKGQNGFVGRLLAHLGTSAVGELLLKLISCDDVLDCSDFAEVIL